MNKIKLFLAIKFFKSLKIKLLGQKSLIFEKVWFSNFFGRKVWFWLKKVWSIKLFKLLTFFHKKVEKVWFQTFLAEKSDFFQKSLKIKLFKLFTTYSNFRKKFNLSPPPRGDLSKGIFRKMSQIEGDTPNAQMPIGHFGF